METSKPGSRHQDESRNAFLHASAMNQGPDNDLSIPPIGLTGAPDDKRWAQYTTTVLVTAGNVAGALIVAAILARSWSVDDFLFYNWLNRCLRLLQLLATFNLGYGMVKYHFADSGRMRHTVLSNALGITILFALILIVILQAFAPTICSFFGCPSSSSRRTVTAVSLWLFGVSIYHVLLCYLRGTEQVRLGNLLSIYGKVLVLVSVSLLAWYWQSMPVPLYFALVGTFTLVGTATLLVRKKTTTVGRLNVSLCGKMLAYSSAGFLDTLFQMLSFVVLTTILVTFARPEIAGQVAILVTLIRGFESLFQPLVLLSLADAFTYGVGTAARQRIQAIWDTILILSVPLVLTAVVLSRTLLSVWLGPEYAELGPAFAIVALLLTPTVATTLLRGNLETLFRYSPVAIVNVSGALLVAAGTVAAHWLEMLSLVTIVSILAVVAYAKFFVVFWMLHQRYSLRIFDGEILAVLLEKLTRRWSGRAMKSDKW